MKTAALAAAVAFALDFLATGTAAAADCATAEPVRAACSTEADAQACLDRAR